MTIYCTIPKKMVSIATLSADSFKNHALQLQNHGVIYPLGKKEADQGFTINLYSTSGRTVSSSSFYMHKTSLRINALVCRRERQ